MNRGKLYLGRDGGLYAVSSAQIRTQYCLGRGRLLYGTSSQWHCTLKNEYYHCLMSDATKMVNKLWSSFLYDRLL